MSEWGVEHQVIRRTGSRKRDPTPQHEVNEGKGIFQAENKVKEFFLSREINKIIFQVI